MSAVRRGTAEREVQYLVLPDISNPLLLARVRWPDVFQAISPAHPDWRADPGLFDLPYDPSSVVVTADQAAVIAEEWGAGFPPADVGAVPGPILIRRMPANWSVLSPAVKRAWWIEQAPAAEPAAREGSRWRRRRRRHEPAAAPDAESLIVLSDVEPADVIDLTDVHRADTVAIEQAPAAEPAAREGSRWRRRHRRHEPAAAPDAESLIVLSDVEPADVIDLTDAHPADTVAIAEEA